MDGDFSPGLVGRVGETEGDVFAMDFSFSFEMDGRSFENTFFRVHSCDYCAGLRFSCLLYRANISAQILRIYLILL